MVARGDLSASSRMDSVEDYLMQLFVVVFVLISWNLFNSFWPHKFGKQKGKRKGVFNELPAYRKKPEQEEVITSDNGREPEQRGGGPVDTGNLSLRKQLDDALLKTEYLEKIIKKLAEHNKVFAEENITLKKKLSESAVPSTVTGVPHDDASALQRKVISSGQERARRPERLTDFIVEYSKMEEQMEILKAESEKQRKVNETLKIEMFDLDVLCDIREKENNDLNAKYKKLLKDYEKLANRGNIIDENTKYLYEKVKGCDEDYGETFNKDEEKIAAGFQESGGDKEAEENEVTKQNGLIILQEATREVNPSNLVECSDLRKLLVGKDVVIKNLEADNINLNCALIIERSYNNKDKTKSMQGDANPNQIIPDEMRGFVDPSSCAYSCGYSVVFFILYWMGLRPCNFKMIREMDNQANIEHKNCYASLRYFVKIGVLKDPKAKTVYCAEITEDYNMESALKDAHEEMKRHSHPALLAMEYQNEEVGHCVAIMSDGRTIIDVQKKRYWFPEEDKPVKSFNVVDVEQNAPKIWVGKCGRHYCVPLEHGLK